MRTRETTARLPIRREPPRRRPYNIARGVAFALVIVGAMLTYALTQTEQLQLAPPTAALLGIVNVGVTTAIALLPRVQGDGRPRAG
jgi:hypothetical protein